MRPGLRQAVVFLVAGGAGAAAAAGVWTAFDGGSFRVAFAVALMIMGAVLAISGGSAISRTGSRDAFAFLGLGPENTEAASSSALTNLGIFLFVSLPLLVAGLLLFGRG
jgi:hypothetical protein